MPNPSVPNVLRGGQTMTAQALMQNFDALSSGLSDGTKDISVNSAAVGSAVTAAHVIVSGDAVVSGDAYGEKAYVMMFAGSNNYSTTGTYFLDWTGAQKLLDGTSVHTFYVPRSGSIVGYVHTVGRYTTGSHESTMSITVGKYASGTSADIFSLGTTQFPSSDPSYVMSGTVSTFTRNVYSLSTGDRLYVRQFVGSAALTVFQSLHLEIQWD